MDASLPTGKQKCLPLRSGMDERASTIARVAMPFHHAQFHKRIYDPRHCRRPDLFRCGQIAKRQRPGEYDNRKRGEPRSVQAALGVLPAELPQKVNRGGVNFPRQFEGLG